MASTKNNTGTQATLQRLLPAILSIKQVSTTSGVIEAQALFTTTPVTLATAGDSVDLPHDLPQPRVSVLPGPMPTRSISDCTTPAHPQARPSMASLTNAGLSTTATTSPTGGVAGWQGYVSQISPVSTTTTGKVITRPAANQGPRTFANQDLPSPTVRERRHRCSSPGGATLSPNFDQRIRGRAYGWIQHLHRRPAPSPSMATDSQTIATNLYRRCTNISGTNIVSQTVSTTTPLTESFDGLAFGFRHSITTASAATVDVKFLERDLRLRLSRS